MTNLLETSKIDRKHVRDLALRLTSWSSETGTPGEASFADRFHDLLMEIPYFREHPEHIRLVASHGEPLTHNVVALVRGTGKRTIAMAGHFDTVSTDNYHELQNLACDTPALHQALIETISARTSRSEQEERALADLLSGDFLPGRGLLDMKSGLAVAVACLEQFAADPDRQGNLVLVATPDEERESRGMRSLRDALPSIVKDLDIDIAAGINLDVTSDQGDGSEGRAVYAGTIGKLLPFALVVGCSSHASYPFEGVSAQAMGAAILSRLEGKAALADRDNNDISPPPICLEAKDLRDGYEVTTPERFWVAFNWLYHTMSADELFLRFKEQVTAGAEEAVDTFAEQALQFGTLAGKSAGAIPAKPRILSFDELKTIAGQVAGEDFPSIYAEEERSLSGIDNPLVVTRRLTAWLVGIARVSGPAVIIGFAGLHYPPSHLNHDVENDRALHEAIEQARSRLASDQEKSVSWKPHFQGISDMSFLGLAAGNSKVVSDNTPISRLIDNPPGDALQFPVVNLGPWGREFHQKFERVHEPYAFAVLPDLVLEIATTFLTKGNR
ncbi:MULTISPECIES: M20/M25/M40 family metallo-hydrolase [unclassified Rhizobium]|jgi:arginine utilization protein RocB|uniref:M20/M25/M40 family metallo-hydrolase n=1 Tax=unclassified Rhizobium TaxID=2613769 RepID=UPI000646AD1F|nr:MULTISPECIES: M20/M25/M40 family metallo-hydrolase [unclassified Rhizobium]MBN8950627.1 M20/M25/M40 family metallo-hydrolase [Rhizobium tropici]OJY66170.1 MAG: peptidase M20 [Rhizobium sp. 60-20]RKD69273.1 arginine utilization protein RocB [Rhizobium sp. WW_1]